MTLDFLFKKDIEQLKHELIAELKLLLKPETCKDEKKDWLTDSETRKLLSLSRTKLYQLRKNGKLPYSKIGGRLYYKREDLNVLLTKNATKYD